MESLLAQAFFVLEQRTDASVEKVQKTYEQCCFELGLIPTPVFLPDTEAETEKPP